MTISEQIDEKHGKDEVVLTVYRSEDNNFTYSLQCHVSRIIRAIFPHQLTEVYSSPQKAKRAAIDTLFDWIKQSRTAKEHLRTFCITDCPYQLEFAF